MQEPVNFPQSVQTPEGKRICPMLSCSAGKASKQSALSHSCQLVSPLWNPRASVGGIFGETKAGDVPWRPWRSTSSHLGPHTVLDPKHQDRRKIPLGCLISCQAKTKVRNPTTWEENLRSWNFPRKTLIILARWQWFLRNVFLAGYRDMTCAFPKRLRHGVEFKSEWCSKLCAVALLSFRGV